MQCNVMLPHFLQCKFFLIAEAVSSSLQHYNGINGILTFSSILNVFPLEENQLSSKSW